MGVISVADYDSTKTALMKLQTITNLQKICLLNTKKYEFTGKGGKTMGIMPAVHEFMYMYDSWKVEFESRDGLGMTLISL